MGLSGADVAALNAAAAAMAPIASKVTGQASAVTSAGSLAAGGAGDGNLGSTITTVARAVSTALTDTGSVVDNLRNAVTAGASSVATATGGHH
jgi:hypothetical protein